jgi:hypothetical protein
MIYNSFLISIIFFIPYICKKLLNYDDDVCEFKFSSINLLLFFYGFITGLSLSHISNIKNLNLKLYDKTRDNLNNFLVMVIPALYILKTIYYKESLLNINSRDLLFLNIGLFSGVLLGYILFKITFNKWRPSVYFYNKRHTANFVITFIIFYIICKMYIEKLKQYNK